jgi:prolyl 4-hydroxylase
MASAPETKPYHEPGIPFSEQCSELRAEVGRNVGEKLDNMPGLWRMTSSPEQPIQLYVRSAFLTPAECIALCRQIDASSYPSPLYEKEKHEGVRTSYSCNLNVYDPLVSEVDARLANLLGIDRAHGEPLQGQRYQTGQEFKQHADFFYIDQPYWEQYGKQGGQRTWTAMIYLNIPQRGGATAFRFLDMAVAPQLGRLLIWNNMALDGSPNPWTEHAGMPVEAGTKYIVTKWYRERHFV